jgi:hypothetical protein
VIIIAVLSCGRPHEHNVRSDVLPHPDYNPRELTIVEGKSILSSRAGVTMYDVTTSDVVVYQVCAEHNLYRFIVQWQDQHDTLRQAKLYNTPRVFIGSRTDRRIP